MDFLIITVIALVVLGIVAALSSIGGKDEPIVTGKGDCSTCTSHDDGSCKIACLMDEARQKKEQAAKQET